ncbi:MAG: type I-F CRISPR-associated endoribonuclease Cas6/Csy4 [Rhodoferax sp.]|nr:type I-F CRISPR-associated endoribonuclease Cas6/Csy4 [Rhodoferax sp.]
MDHYVDIDVQPDPEFPAAQLMNALYAKLHRALVLNNSTLIGVSFPNVDKHLGARMRLHGSEDVLQSLLTSDWLAGMRDHATLTPPIRVPETSKYCVVRRVQVKSSTDRLRRRLMRRHNVDETEALKRIPDEVARTTNLPFVQLRSTSTGQSFKLFIEHGPIQSQATEGDFSTYGLSQGATIPWF